MRFARLFSVGLPCGGEPSHSALRFARELHSALERRRCFPHKHCTMNSLAFAILRLARSRSVWKGISVGFLAVQAYTAYTADSANDDRTITAELFPSLDFRPLHTDANIESRRVDCSSIKSHPSAEKGCMGRERAYWLSSFRANRPIEQYKKFFLTNIYTGCIMAKEPDARIYIIF